MKFVILVLVCGVLVGCLPRSRIEPKPKPKPCRPAEMACIVHADGFSLIRAPTFWVLDLRGNHGSDLTKVIDAARQCDGPRGCGVAITEPEIAALERDLAPTKVERLSVERLSVAGRPVIAYRPDLSRIVFEGWGSPATLPDQLPPFASLLAAPCIPAQCEGTPPLPPRFEQSIFGPPWPIFGRPWPDPRPRPLVAPPGSE